MEIFVIFLCLVFNAILSCIEMAFVTVSRPQLKQLAEKGHKPAQRVLSLKSNPERVLSVLQIGITLVGAVSAAVSGAGAEEILSPFYMNNFAVSEHVSEALAIATVVLPLTYFSVVIGELVPKSLALKFPMRFSMAGGMLLIFLDRLFAPAVWALEISTQIITKLLFRRLKNEAYTESAHDLNLDNLTDAHKQYVFNLINVDKRKVKDVMVDWSNVTTIKYTDHYTVVLSKIKDSRHTRMPVIQNDEVIGLLHAKEFVSETEVVKLDWTTLIRHVLVFNPHEPILNALKKLQQNKSHLAIITYGEKSIDKIMGIVTLEDIFEEVVGEIYDEDDNPRTLLSTNSRIRTMSIQKK